MRRAAPTAPNAHAPVLVRPSAKPPITPYITRGIPAQHGGVREYPGSLIRPPGTPTGPPDRTVPTIVRPRRWTNPGGVGSGARSRCRRSTARTRHGRHREDSPITTQTLGGRPRAYDRTSLGKYGWAPPQLTSIPWARIAGWRRESSLPEPPWQAGARGAVNAQPVFFCRPQLTRQRPTAISTTVLTNTTVLKPHHMHTHAEFMIHVLMCTAP